MKHKKQLTGTWIRLLGFLVILIIVAGPGYYQFNQVRPLEYITGVYQSTDHLPDLYEFNFTKNQAFFRFNGKIKKVGDYIKAGDHVYLCRFRPEDRLITLVSDGFYYYDEAADRVIRFIKKSPIPQTIPTEHSVGP